MDQLVNKSKIKLNYKKWSAQRRRLNDKPLTMSHKMTTGPVVLGSRRTKTKRVRSSLVSRWSFFNLSPYHIVYNILILLVYRSLLATNKITID